MASIWPFIFISLYKIIIKEQCKCNIFAQNSKNDCCCHSGRSKNHLCPPLGNACDHDGVLEHSPLRCGRIGDCRTRSRRRYSLVRLEHTNAFHEARRATQSQAFDCCEEGNEFVESDCRHRNKYSPELPDAQICFESGSRTDFRT